LQCWHTALHLYTCRYEVQFEDGDVEDMDREKIEQNLVPLKSTHIGAVHTR
jgi:hypothetical protein